MKKLSIILLIIVVMILNGCSSQPASVEFDNFNNDKIITYKHLKHGDTSDLAGVILFEYEMDNYTKYQLTLDEVFADVIYLVLVELRLQTTST